MWQFVEQLYVSTCMLISALWWAREQKYQVLWERFSELSINIHLTSCCRHARFQESEGSFNNDAIQQIAGTGEDQWGWGVNSALL